MMRVGKMLRDKWRIDALLGVGGTAAVYAATHRNGKRAALKLLRRELLASPDLVTRFVREGYVANRLEHPGVVSVLDDDKDEDGAPFLVMELLEGHSLERHTRKQYPLPFSRIIDIGDQLLDVLATAHHRGIVHRDIKPANVFLQKDGTVKVLDFGIARITEPLEASMTQTGTAIGTPSYMPPEQARGRWKLVDARTDVWAAGATLYALLGTCKPRRADTVQEELLLAMTEPVVPLSKVAPHVPQAIAEIVERAMQFDIAHRYPSAEAMQAALRTIAPTFGVEVSSTARSLPISKRSNTALLGEAVTSTSQSYSYQPSTDPLPGRSSSIPSVSHPSGASASETPGAGSIPPGSIHPGSASPVSRPPSVRPVLPRIDEGPHTTGRPISGPATMDTAAHVVAFRSSSSPRLAFVATALALALGAAAMFYAGRSYMAGAPPTPAAQPIQPVSLTATAPSLSASATTAPSVRASATPTATGPVPNVRIEPGRAPTGAASGSATPIYRQR